MTTAEIFQKVASGEITPDEAQVLVAQMQQKPIQYKVSPKGALSVYGLQRFPVTLYRSQWERLDADKDNRAAFMAANKHLLTEKG